VVKCKLLLSLEIGSLQLLLCENLSRWGEEGLFKLLALALMMTPIGAYGDIARGRTCDGGATVRLC
jgi:hypothetical protein